MRSTNNKIRLVIPHGGSGTGVTYWSRYAEGCLIAADLCEVQHGFCQQLPEYFRFGTLFHLLITANGHQIKPHEVEIIDEVCGNWEDEVLEEGWRIYEGYCAWLDGKPEFDDGKIIGREVNVSGSALDAIIGITGAAGTVDVIVQKPNGNIWIYDYKTAGKRGNTYMSGNYLLQRWMYSCCATALGYEVEKFVFRQVLKTKKIDVVDYEMQPPTPAEIKMLRNYLLYAKKQKDVGVRGPHLKSCKWCTFKDNPCVEGM